jgi:uncharacterized protein (TIGR02145 family)
MRSEVKRGNMKNNLRKNRKTTLTYVGIFSTMFLLTFAAVGLYSPVVKTNAEEFYNVDRLSMQIYSRLSLAILNSEDALTIVPSSEGSFKSKKITARVMTNQPTGYRLVLSSNTSSYASNTSDSSKKITSNFEGSVTSETMPINSWGFSSDNENFLSVYQTFYNNSTYQLKTTTDTSDTDFDLYIGAKIGNTLPFGDYTGSVYFTAYTESSSGGAAASMYGISTLQQMTSNVCSYTPTPDSSATEAIWEYDNSSSYSPKIPHKKLVDTRDGKEYIVAKYPDGKCWITENMDYVIDPTAELTRYDTNLTMSYVNPVFNFTNPTMTSLTGFKEDDVYQTGTNNLTAAPERSYAPQGSERYYQDGTTQASVPTDNTDAYTWEKTGVYYNYPAAALNYLSSSSNYVSICPYGWKLPSPSDITSLVSRYTDGSGNIDMKNAPFIFSGKITYDADADETKLVDTGTAGYYWTSSLTSSNSRYLDYVVKVSTDGTTYSTENANVYDGAQVKCIYNSSIYN